MAETSVLMQAGEEIVFLRADNEVLRKELATKDARIAELEAALAWFKHKGPMPTVGGMED